MRLRFVPEAAGIVAASPYVIKDPQNRKGKWKETLAPGDVSRPLFMEIGMGKGRFIIEMAASHPEAEYLGVERYESVLFRACERMAGIPYNTPADKLERELHPELDADFSAPPNLHFLSVDARELPELFAPGEIDGLFLNFSDPWPKARHARRRLTSREFLARYEQFLKDQGRLTFKTDNQALFDFSLEEISEAPHWELETVTRDLHHDPVLMEGNIMTEYERRFSALGNKICRLTAVYHAPESPEF